MSGGLFLCGENETLKFLIDRQHIHTGKDEIFLSLQVAERAQVLGSGLIAKGCQSNPKQFVGIFAQNRPEVTHTRTHTDTNACKTHIQ